MLSLTDAIPGNRIAKQTGLKTEIEKKSLILRPLEYYCLIFMPL
jgi:hypothetical protein